MATMVIEADDPVSSDEAIARALQERFREEDEAAARASSARDATALPLSPPSSDDASAVAARRLMDEELRAAEAFETTSTYYGGGNVVGGSGSDADVARRMEQEASDAALAASLARQDQIVMEGRATQEDEATRERRERRLRRRRSMNTCFVCALVALFVFAVAFKFLPQAPSIVGGGGGEGGFGPFDPREWFSGGDWETGYKQGNNAWASSRQSSSGLELRVLNNLDEKWQGTFSAVMNEWDSGDPDAVSFVIERINDRSCRMVPNAMVVCNGNYGRTDWRGINELVTNNGYVVSSVAKLNDYFLDGTDDALRTYVCCHEIGHGLGLGHTDEGIYNADLGECMDYTIRPEVNMHPGRANFEALADMYGVVADDGGRVREHKGFNRRTEEAKVEYSPNDLEWRALRRTARSEHYESDLGDGRKIRRVLLLA